MEVSVICGKLRYKKTLIGNKVSLDIINPVYNAIKKHENHPSIKKLNIS